MVLVMHISFGGAGGDSWCKKWYIRGDFNLVSQLASVLSHPDQHSYTLPGTINRLSNYKNA